jgi:hypothetical protein
MPDGWIVPGLRMKQDFRFRCARLALVKSALLRGALPFAIVARPRNICYLRNSPRNRSCHVCNAGRGASKVKTLIYVYVRSRSCCQCRQVSERSKLSSWYGLNGRLQQPGIKQAASCASLPHSHVRTSAHLVQSPTQPLPSSDKASSER